MSKWISCKAVVQPEVRGPRARLGWDKLLLAGALAVFFFAAGARAQTSGFTYQGRLTDSGTAANGNYDLQFGLWDSLSGGTQVGSTQSLNTVAVTSGVFTVSLDFGASSFPGANRFLEISARPSGSGSFILLLPRQQVTATPYAVRSASAGTADTATTATSATNATTATTATNATQLGGLAASQYVQTNDSRLTDARPPTAGSANYIQNTSSAQSGNFNISGNGAVGGTLTAGGSVGIGTTAPEQRLHVVGNEILSTGSQGGFKFRDRGSNSSADDWAWYSIGNIARLFRNGVGDLLAVSTAGNVGVGTVSPQAKLDVRGDVKLGSTGQLFAPGGEENLRIIRGRVDIFGQVSEGSGFTSTNLSAGVFLINFDTPFSGTPSVTVTAEKNSNPFGGDVGVVTAMIDANCGCDRTKTVKVVLSSNADSNLFVFTAIGPR